MAADEPPPLPPPPPPPIPVSTYTDDEGRVFEYVYRPHDGASGLAVHLSAFFGKWGDAKPYRDRFRGYFHRLKMLGDEPAHNWLFLCDAYGAYDNGTYYTGEKGDFYVERATLAIIRQVMAEGGHAPAQTAMVGSSMGATAALKFGLTLRAAGILAISPHIDLDICALRQNRLAEVEFLIPSGAVDDVANHPYTRQVRTLVESWPAGRSLPRLVMQSCLDDAGVHDEQVVPLARLWRETGGEVVEDYRPTGGHTSDFATKPMMLDAIGCLIGGRPIDVRRYQTEAGFAGALTRPPLTHRLRRAASLTRKRLLGR